MKIEIDINSIVKDNISPNQYILLYLLYFQEIDLIKSLYSKKEALTLRNSLVGTKYLLNNNEANFYETVLSKNNVEKLLNIKSDSINFWEFYSVYPVKVGSRVLRAGSYDTVIGKKHEKKYLSRVKKLEQHHEAIKAVETYVSKQKQNGKLDFLPNMETVLNNALWESWKELIPLNPEEEGKEWNTDII